VSRSAWDFSRPSPTGSVSGGRPARRTLRSQYTAKLNPYLPDLLVPALAWMVTIGETVAGVALVAGVYLRPAAILAAVLLLGFSVGMTIGTGIKSALDASVPPAAAAALLLAVWPGERA
jgi:uncharacterized membrane protein YphA (DoxX/SURF4 family)